MTPDSEFKKPLRARDPKAGRNRTRTLWVLLGVFLLFAVPLTHFYDGFSRIAQVFTPERQQPQIIVVEKDHDPEPELPQNVGDGEEQSGQTDNGIEREGNVIRITPKPAKQPQALQPVEKPIRRQETTLAHLPDPDLVERGATGVIPKKSSDGLRAMDVYSRQADTEGNFGVARVVLVIGGMGISQTSTQEAIQKLPSGVTLAFAPYGNSLTRWMQEARKSGHELLLQVPMEPIGYPQNNPGRHTLRSDVDLQENLANLHWSMSRMTNYVGITNYLGNRIMGEASSLTPIFDEIAERGLLFFDDGTVKNSVAEGVAVKSLLPFAKGNIVIDNVRTRASIAENLRKLAEQAKRTGVAVGVGNAFPDTIAMVSEFTRRARENGIEITPVSAIVRDPKR